eukprot:6780795-Alexandrium_andersonii.AAC.1
MSETGCSSPHALHRRVVFWYAAIDLPGTTSGSRASGQPAALYLCTRASSRPRPARPDEPNDSRASSGRPA